MDVWNEYVLMVKNNVANHRYRPTCHICTTVVHFHNPPTPNPIGMWLLSSASPILLHVLHAVSWLFSKYWCIIVGLLKGVGSFFEVGGLKYTPWKSLASKVAQVPKKLMSRGGGGGGHFFFQSAINVNWVGRGTCVPSVDLRGDKQKKKKKKKERKKKKKKKTKGFQPWIMGGRRPPIFLTGGAQPPPSPPGSYAHGPTDEKCLFRIIHV